MQVEDVAVEGEEQDSEDEAPAPAPVAVLLPLVAEEAVSRNPASSEYDQPPFFWRLHIKISFVKH